MNKGTLVIAAHDAGGAHQVLQYASRYSGAVLASLSGPAIEMFHNFSNKTIDLVDEETALDEGTWLLWGTSILDRGALKLANRFIRQGKRTVAWLDHYTLFRERFMHSDGSVIDPCEVWVHDTYQLRLARESFADSVIRQKPNLQLERFLEEIIRCSDQETGRTLLWLNESVENEVSPFQLAPYGYKDFDGLRYLISNLDALGTAINQIVIRPHPAEPINRCFQVIRELRSKTSIPLVVDNSRSLAKQVKVSALVGGCDTYAMVLALHAGKRVVSCIPPGGLRRSLPHEEIEDLQDLILAGSPSG